MTLPDHSEGRFPLLKPGKYTFRITDIPEKRRYGQATGIIIKFTAINEFGEAKDNSILLFPFPDRETGYSAYKILKDEIIKSSEEIDWVGKSFLGEIEIGPHPTKEGRQQQKIVNIQPFPKARAKLGAEEHEEVEDTTITPPSEEEPVDSPTVPPEEEEGDPGPGEEDGPPKEEEKDTTPPPPEEDEEPIKKDFPKDDKEKDGPPW